MKKVFLLMMVAFVLSTNISAQKSEPFSITPMQAGTINLNKSNAVINLADEIKETLRDASSSYYVLFTAVNNAPLPSISNKNNLNFTVLTTTDNVKAGGEFTVDYIVFVKRKLIDLSKITQKPPHNTNN